MRLERFKMERQGLVTEGQEVEISERSPSTGRYTYLVEPSVAVQQSLENEMKAYGVLK